MPPDAASSSSSSHADALAAARDAAVLCDLAPLSILAISGPDASAFLQGQVSSDVTALSDEGAQFSSYNSPKGRMLANFVLWRERADDFRLLLAGDVAAAVQKRLAMFVLRSKVTLTDISAAHARFGIGGPKAGEATAAAFGTTPGLLAVARTEGATLFGLPGPRYVAIVAMEAAAATATRLARNAVRAPFTVWQWLTIRAGIPVLSAALQDRFVAQDVNWDVLGGINFRKGCYAGQEIIARMHYLGRRKERLFAFHADTNAVGAGSRVCGPEFGEQACGVVVNAAPAPGGGSDLLAVVQIAAAAGDLHLDAPDGPSLVAWPLPYVVPPAAPPPGRVGAAS